VNFTCENHQHLIVNFLNLKPFSFLYVEKLTYFCCMKGEASTLYQRTIILCVCMHTGTSVLEQACNQSMFSSLLLMTKYSFYDSDQSHFDKAFII